MGGNPPQGLGVTKHSLLTDKEIAGVMDHADNSVSDLKLASQSFMLRDHFGRALETNNWSITTSGSGSYADDIVNHWLSIRTGSTMGSLSRVYSKLQVQLDKVQKVTAEYRVKVNYVGGNFERIVGLRLDDNNRIYMSRNNSVTVSDGTSSSGPVGSGWGDTTGFVVLRIEATSTEIKFYRDGGLQATLNTNIPASSLLSVFVEVTNPSTTSNIILDIDYVSIRVIP